MSRERERERERKREQRIIEKWRCYPVTCNIPSPPPKMCVLTQNTTQEQEKSE